MDEYGVLELPAPVRATDDTSFNHETRGSDDRREVARSPGHGAQPPGPGGRAVTAPPAPVLADSEVARLQRVLEDVRFSLERGYWQAALGATRAALTATRRSSDESAAHDHREQERAVLPRR